MATATKKARSAVRGARASEPLSKPRRMRLLVAGDGGMYHWSIAEGSGVGLARSGRSEVRHHAERATRCAPEGTGSARLEGRPAEVLPPVSA
jgi:hypothetical protein